MQVGSNGAGSYVVGVWHGYDSGCNVLWVLNNVLKLLRLLFLKLW